jgi:hypothetical protein
MRVEEEVWPQRQLQRECKEISDRLLWNVQLRKEVVYLYPMKLSDWVAFLLTRYHKEVVETIQTLPIVDRFFYQTKVNRFKQLSIWCVRGKQSEAIIERLKSLPNVQLEPLPERIERDANHQEHQRFSS